MKLSEKQRWIIDSIKTKGSITKKEVVDKFDCWYYHNAEHYIGEILSNMVNKRYIKRVKNGVFELGSLSNQLPGNIDPDQITLL